MTDEATTEDLESNNLAFWNSVEETDLNFTKRVKYGKRSFTSIGAYYQIKNATKVWGMYGKAWGLKDFNVVTIGKIVEDGNEMPAALILHSTFYYPGGEFPIITDGKFSPGADLTKKLQTDLITKALSRLGFNADVFLGRFDANDKQTDTKYGSHSGGTNVDDLL